MTRRDSLAATIGIKGRRKPRGWVRRGIKFRALSKHTQLWCGYDLCTGVRPQSLKPSRHSTSRHARPTHGPSAQALGETPVGLYGAVSLVDGSKHETVGCAREWDLAKKAIAS